MIEHALPILLTFLAHHWITILSVVATFILSKLPVIYRLPVTIAVVLIRTFLPMIIQAETKKKEEESCLGSGLN